MEGRLADVRRLVAYAPEGSKRTAHAVALSLLLSPGLLLIDHIHFQYNGFMYGILLLSILLARSPSTRLASGLLFAMLLCFKHIYLYLAPAYFVYLLRAYCLGPNFDICRLSPDIRFANCIKLGVGIVAIFGTALGPFMYWGQLSQLASRLFPFSRGLCHAYWAPNVWAMYSFMDRVLIYAAPRLGLNVDNSALNSVTRGLVGDTAFAVLPGITPRITFTVTLFFQILPLVKLFAVPTFDNFVGAVTLCGYASFLFGWHVHEKAILLVIFPFRCALPVSLGEPQLFLTHRQPPRPQGPPLLRRFPASRRRRPCLTLPPSLHRPGIPDQDCLYHRLAGGLPHHLRQAGTHVTIWPPMVTR